MEGGWVVDGRNGTVVGSGGGGSVWIDGSHDGGCVWSVCVWEGVGGEGLVDGCLSIDLLLYATRICPEQFLGDGRAPNLIRRRGTLTRHSGIALGARGQGESLSIPALSHPTPPPLTSTTYSSNLLIYPSPFNDPS